MLDILKHHVPEAALLKLNTFDADVSDLNTTHIPLKVDFALIDAEHTITAVFRDFLGGSRTSKVSYSTKGSNFGRFFCLMSCTSSSPETLLILSVSRSNASVSTGITSFTYRALEGNRQ